MEPIYAVKSTYDEDMFYHQVVASKPRMMPKEGDGKKIKFQLPDFGETSGKKANSVSADKNQALQLLESSGLKGDRCTMNFYEDTFTMERPGIITEYQYEGIAWIKETSKYYMVFWNKSLAIPVEKAGFYRGKKETFGSFLEKRCNKVIEKVRNV